MAKFAWLFREMVKKRKKCTKVPALRAQISALITWYSWYACALFAYSYKTKTKHKLLTWQSRTPPLSNKCACTNAAISTGTSGNSDSSRPSPSCKSSSSVPAGAGVLGGAGAMAGDTGEMEFRAKSKFAAGACCAHFLNEQRAAYLSALSRFGNCLFCSEQALHRPQIWSSGLRRFAWRTRKIERRAAHCAPKSCGNLRAHGPSDRPVRWQCAFSFFEQDWQQRQLYGMECTGHL